MIFMKTIEFFARNLILLVGTLFVITGGHRVPGKKRRRFDRTGNIEEADRFR